MQKTGYRLRNILLLAILILMAGAAASIAEDQLSPEGPRVIGRLFGTEAQAAAEYLDYDLANYNNKSLTINVTKPEQQIRLKQSNNQTPVNVKILINWNAKYPTNVPMAFRMDTDSINIGSGFIKIEQGSSLSGGDTRIQKQVDVYCKGDNAIKSTTADHCISSTVYNARLFFHREAEVNDEGVIRLVNTHDPERTLGINGETVISNGDYVDVSGLGADETVRMEYNSGTKNELAYLVQGQLPIAQVPKELQGWHRVDLSLPAASSSAEVYVDETGKFNFFDSHPNGFNNIVKPGSSFALKFGKDNIYNWRYTGIAAAENIESSGRRVPRVKNLKLPLTQVSQPNVSAVTANSITINTLKGATYTLCDANGNVLKTETATGDSITYDNLSTHVIYKAKAKLGDLESKEEDIFAYDFKDSKTLADGLMHVPYSESVATDGDQGANFRVRYSLRTYPPSEGGFARINGSNLEYTPAEAGRQTLKVWVIPYLNGKEYFSCYMDRIYTYTVKSSPDVPEFDSFGSSAVTLKNVRKGVEYQCYDGVTLKESITAKANGALTFKNLTAGKVYGFSARVPGSADRDPGYSSGSILVKPFTFAPSPANGVYQNEYSQKVAAQPSGNYRYILDGGKLPEGLSLAEDGTISGTPTKAGSYSSIKIKAIATDAGLVDANSLTNDVAITIDPAKPQTPAAPTVKAGTEGVDTISLNANAVPDAGTIADLAKAPYEYAVSSVNGQDVGTPVWQDSTDFTGLKQGSSYTFAARFKATDNTTASDASAWSAAVTTKVTVKVPAIALEGGSTCATEGQACQISSDVTHKGDIPADAVLNVGDVVTYTITPCTEHSFRSLSINNTALTEEQLSVDKGVVTAAYTVKAEDSDVLAKAVMGDKQVTGVEPMQEYKILANATPNLSFNDLTTDVNNLVKVRYRYDNDTVLDNQTTVWTLDGGQNYDRKGGTWKYSGTAVNNITPKLDAVVTPVTGTAEPIAPVTKGVSKMGYNSAAALGIPAQTVVNFDNNVDKTAAIILWDSLPANFGKTAATHTLKGQLSNVPEWATINKEVSVDITIVDAEILKVAGGVSVKDKVYDGTINAELVVDEGGILLTNEAGELVENIKADASKAVASYKTAGAGAGIGITVEGVTLTSGTEGFDPSRYALDFGSVTGAISKATPEITAPTTDKATYGTALKDIVLKGGKAAVGSKEYEGTFSWKNGEEIPNVENQGYTAVFTPEDANNLNSVETTVAVALDKKAVTAIPDAGQAKTYGEADPALTYTLDAPLVEGNEMTGALSRENGETVGDYEIVPGSLSAGPNYRLTVVQKVSFKVNQKAITPVATAEDREYKAGDTDAKVTVTLPEVLAADQKEVVAINYRGKFADDAVGSPKTVTVSGIQLFGPNKADNYRLTTTTVTTRAAITNVWPKITETPTAEGITYGQKLSDTALTGGAAVDKNNPSVTVAGHFEWAEPDKVPDAGSYSAKVKFVPDNQNNYGTATLESPVVVAVAKRDVHITPDAGQTKIYGAEDPEALTYTVADGDLLDDGAALTGALTREPGEDAGSYAIINNDLSAGSNYNIVVAEESFAIAPKNVTITAEAADRGYISGNVDAEVTLTINGAIAGDDVKATFTSAVFEDDAVGIEKTVTVSGIALTGEKAGNYLLPEGAETATTKASISNATVEITNVPTAKNGITYGQPLSDVQLEGGKAIDTQTKTEVTGAFAWKTPDQVLTDIGDAQAAVVFTPEDLESYGKAEAKVTVSVGKKAIDVAPAAGQTKVFGSSDPNSYGFEVSGETPLVGDDKLMDVLTRAEGEDAGEYAYSLTESAAANTHYTITLKNADTVKFSITKATPAAPVMPVLKDSTSDTVTLETIEVTDAVAVKAGAAVEYGIIDAENAAKWQAGPVFEGLEGNTAYRFIARYAATKNTEASPESGILDVKTPVGGVVIDTPAVSGVPEGTEGISVTADKLDEAVKAGEEVTFTLTGNKAKEGSYVPYGFTINGEAVACGKMNADTRSCEVIYTVQDADVERGSLNSEVLFTRLGNINTDDKINGIDALLIQRAAAGLGEPLSEEKAVAADVNMDGKRNGIDALLIKRFAAGLSEAL